MSRLQKPDKYVVNVDTESRDATAGCGISRYGSCGRDIRAGKSKNPNSFQYTVGIVPGGEDLPESPKTDGINMYAVRKNQCSWPLSSPKTVCGAIVEDPTSEYCEACKKVLQSRIARYHDVLELYLLVNNYVHTKVGDGGPSPRGESRAERGVDHAMSGVHRGRTAGLNSSDDALIDGKFGRSY